MSIVVLYTLHAAGQHPHTGPDAESFFLAGEDGRVRSQCIFHPTAVVGGTFIQKSYVDVGAFPG